MLKYVYKIKKGGEQMKKRFCITVEPWLYVRVKAQAEKEHRKITTLIELALKEYLKKQDD